MTEQCKNCKFYEHNYPDGHRGDCRFNPPSFVTNNGMMYTMSPEVDEDDWCGRFQPIEPGVDEYPEGGG